MRMRWIEANVDPWSRLQAELDAWAEASIEATLWWRDDDAFDDTSALRTLLADGRITGFHSLLCRSPPSTGWPNAYPITQI